MLGELRELCQGRPDMPLMEVCGTHTVSLFRSGVKSLLPGNVRLLSGPGCPVCVTSQGYIDAACELAGRAGVTVCTYGDMMRVPGRHGSLADRRGQGGRVVVVYSTRDAVRYACEHRDEQVVFLAVGFETTAPATAAGVLEARRLGLENFTVLTAHKLVVPAMLALLSGGEVPISGFLCPGHVSVIIGAAAYEPIVRQFAKPCVVAGFEPAQMLLGILHLARQVADGRAAVENVYGVAVNPGGNAAAQKLLDETFEPADAVWRAIGVIPASGLELRESFASFDAARRFGLDVSANDEPSGCLCGQVIQGKAQPGDCPLFGKVCTPMQPVGPCMVSSEGTCSAWYKYGPK
jgi:hydrogenase expression/formation protein HypD